MDGQYSVPHKDTGHSYCKSWKVELKCQLGTVTKVPNVP